MHFFLHVYRCSHLYTLIRGTPKIIAVVFPIPCTVMFPTSWRMRILLNYFWMPGRHHHNGQIPHIPHGEYENHMFATISADITCSHVGGFQQVGDNPSYQTLKDYQIYNFQPVFADATPVVSTLPMPSFSNQKIDAAMFRGSSIFTNQSSDPPYGWARTKIWQSAPLNFLSSLVQQTKIVTSLCEMEELYHTWNPSNKKKRCSYWAPIHWSNLEINQGFGGQKKWYGSAWTWS